VLLCWGGCGGGGAAAGSKAALPARPPPAAPPPVAPPPATPPPAASPPNIPPAPTEAAAPPAPTEAAPPAPTEATAPPDGGCTQLPWQDDQIVGEASYRGKLEAIEASLPNGQLEKTLIVFLDRPACLPPNSASQDESGTETSAIQVYSPDPAVSEQLQALIGKRVVVTGEGFLWHTAHHHRPIVVDVKIVTAK
jgi:hypothetical protein